MATEETRLRTVCNRDCPDACGIVATVRDGRAVRLAGDPDHPVTRGFLCYRTQHFLEQQYGPDRVTTPLVRAPGGGFREASWEEALDLAAEKLLAVRRESGPAAVFQYRSGGSLGLLQFLTDYLFESFGPVTVKRGDICSGAGDAAQMLDFGEEDSHDLFDLLNARHIILWGKNPAVSGPHLLPVLREARERGARIVLVDPVFHKTASLCEAHHAVRPGGDFALAMGVARALFDAGRADPRAGEYCDGLDALRDLSREQSVEAWCALADLPAAAAHDLAGRLADGPAAILVGWGMGRRANGAGIVRALDALGAISGNLGVPGGGVSFYFKRRGAFDAGSLVRGPSAAPRTVCEPTLGPDLLALRDPPVRAAWVSAGNPVAMLPESNTVARALGSLEFLVVVDPFMTDTARLAHLVLPTATLLEADDVLGSYGHHYLGSARPVISPPPGVRSELAILQGLAARLGLAGLLDGDARSWKARLLRPEAADGGKTLAQLESGAAVRNPLAPRVLFEGRRFATASGRVNLVTEAPPDPLAAPDPDYPLVLMALSTERSQSSQWPRPPEGPLVLTVHPDAAAGLPDGALATLESRAGSMTVRLRHDARQRRDVALAPKGGHLRDGRCANALVRARTTDLGEGGALYDERVRLRPASAAG